MSAVQKEFDIVVQAIANLGQLEHALSRARVALNVPGTHSEHVVEPWEAA